MFYAIVRLLLNYCYMAVILLKHGDMTVFFYCKIIIKGGDFMLSDATMQKFFTTPEIANLSVGEQGEMIKYFQAGLRTLKEDNENATISELFESTKPVQQSVS